MSLGAFVDEDDEAVDFRPQEAGHWTLDEDDMLLMALLQDPIYCAELLLEDPTNYEYGGMYKVRDHQYPLFWLDMEGNWVGVASARDTGKALVDDTPVLTPAGWKPIADLDVGDCVVGSDGMPTPILGVYPQGEREVWAVELLDGTIVECDEEHRWTVTCDSWNRRRQSPRPMTVREMHGRRARFKVPPVAPIRFTALPDPEVSPWLVGALLGDGNLTRPTMIRLASVDQDLVDRARAETPADAELVHDGGCSYRWRAREYVYAAPGRRSAGRAAHQLLAWSRRIGLHGHAAHEKRVPAEYLWGSIETRLELLRGLVDTDGSISGSGGVEISTASPALAADIRHLAWSLGGRAALRRGPTPARDRYRVWLRLPDGMEPCWLPRKLRRYYERLGATNTAWRGIRSTRPTGQRKSMTCIEVAAADGLFVTRGFALTHNTESIKAKAVSHAFRRQGEKLLLTAPELIHLLPLTDQVEERIQSVRLLNDFLDTRNGKTGFTHRPFGVDFLDGTKIVGRIPRLTGPQPVSAKVLTPTGWTTMGELRPGDLVMGPSGRPTPVLGVTNTWYADVFRVSFTDGSSTLADAKHRWRVRTDARDWHVLYTEDLRAALAGPPKQHGGSLNMLRVPQQGVCLYESFAGSPLDPYVVGALLGDGSISGHSAELTCADPELVARLESRLPDSCSVTQISEIRYLLVGPGRGYANPVLDALRTLGLMGCTAHTKFIPERYKRGSTDERLEVLRGLLDTDGTAKDSGAAHLVSASKQLVEDAAEIVRSLGGWASTGAEVSVAGGTYHRGTFRIRGVVPFALARKAGRYAVDGRQRHRSICRVEPEGWAEVRCIQVAADDQAYLTDDLIATLNTGVKGQHQPDLMIDEAQDYPDKGWIEVFPTVMKDHVDRDGESDFSFVFYGVHSGARDSQFAQQVAGGAFKIVQVTQLQKASWSQEEKRAAKSMYGGTQSSDYRRNILGEAGGASSPFFVTARLMACVDQDRESRYNELEYRFQQIRAEEFDEDDMTMRETLDLPTGLDSMWLGGDIGLTTSPTVLTLWSHEKVKQVERLKLVRRFELERMRTTHIRQAFYAIAEHFGPALKGVGVDSTGLGFPLMQEMEDDPDRPRILDDVMRGYFFNSNVPVHVNKAHVRDDGRGNLRDQFGAAVKEETDPLSGETRFVTYMPMIEASTRYLRELVDPTILMLPFDPPVVADMQGETQQRVKRIAGLKQKPNAFHILDSMRAMAMAYRAGEVEAALASEAVGDVLDYAL